MLVETTPPPLCRIALRPARRHAWLAAAICQALAVAWPTAHAATLSVSDVAAAAGKSGCESIAYAGEQTRCKANQVEIEACKKAIEAQWPDREEKAKLGVFAQIAKNLNAIGNLQRQQEREAVKLKKTPAALAVVLGELTKEIKTLEAANTRLRADQRTHEAGLNIPRIVTFGSLCVGHRAAQRQLFERVILMLNRGQDFPKGDADRKLAFKHGDTCIQHMHSEERTHREQEDAWRNRVDHWERVAALVEPAP